MLCAATDEQGGVRHHGVLEGSYGSGIPLVPQLGDETDDALRQDIGFLERRKMAAGLRDRPAPEVEESLRQRAWGANDLVGELYVARRRFDSPSLRAQVVDYPLPVVAGVLGPKRRPDGARRPIHHHRREQVVSGESALRITVAPPGELLDDPTKDAGRRRRNCLSIADLTRSTAPTARKIRAE